MKRAGGRSQNIAKPAYRAFQLLKDAGCARLPVRTTGQALPSSPISVWATVNASAAKTGTRGLQIFASNFWPEALGGDPRPLNTTTVEVKVAGLPGSVTSATLTRVDDNVTRPYFLWEGWDAAACASGQCNSQCTSSTSSHECACLKYLSAEQLEQLEAASAPAVEAVAVAEGAVRFSLAPYAIVRVRFH